MEKKEKEISKEEKMIFTIQSQSEKTIKKIYDNSMKELDKFFDLNWKRYLPLIFLIPDRKTIDKLMGRKTEDWLVGWAMNKSIFLLNPKNYEKESCHKYSSKEYTALLKHELCHLFYGALSKHIDNPLWLNEGVATYLSGQNKFKKRPKKFLEFLEFYSKGGKGIYRESGFAIEILVKKFGKIKLLNLIKNLPQIKHKKEFDSKFKEIYGFIPSYRKFNELHAKVEKKEIKLRKKK